MSAVVVSLDTARRWIFEQMFCRFCHTTHALRHIVRNDREYHPCPGCDEEASSPLRIVLGERIRTRTNN
jgi:hypothetical protein